MTSGRNSFRRNRGAGSGDGNDRETSWACRLIGAGCGAPWPEFVVAVPAIQRLGAAAVLIGPASKHDEVAHAVSDSDRGRRVMAEK